MERSGAGSDMEIGVAPTSAESNRGEVQWSGAERCGGERCKVDLIWIFEWRRNEPHQIEWRAEWSRERSEHSGTLCGNWAGNDIIVEAIDG